MSTLTTAQGEQLVDAFVEWFGEARVLTLSEIQAFVRGVRASMKPDWPCTVDNVLSTLERHGTLSGAEIASEGDYRPFLRYVTPEATAYDVAVKIRPRGYFSHATAVFAHGLTEQIPQTIYINDEQSEKPAPSGKLTQGGLDRAFKARQRVSKFVFVYGQNRIVILNGKQTHSLGVKSIPLSGRLLAVTDLERTLIDITVRPSYGGGVYEIIAAYRAAADRLEVGKLVKYLAKLNYVYPYHQAIGYYLERAGVSARRTAPLRKLGLDFDFYLVHGLKNTVLDKSWRVNIPEGL